MKDDTFITPYTQLPPLRLRDHIFFPAVTCLGVPKVAFSDKIADRVSIDISDLLPKRPTTRWGWMKLRVRYQWLGLQRKLLILLFRAYLRGKLLWLRGKQAFLLFDIARLLLCLLFAVSPRLQVLGWLCAFAALLFAAIVGSAVL